MSFYDYEAEDVRDNLRHMSEYEGKVVLVVNTATQCGFTPQYDALQDLYERYQSQGFEVLDFSCDQFAHQALGSSEEIAALFDQEHPLTPMMESMLEREHPDYRETADIKWNFTKFLIDRQGNVVARFEPTADMDKIRYAIEGLL